VKLKCHFLQVIIQRKVLFYTLKDLTFMVHIVLMGFFFAEDEEWRTEVQGVIVERNKGSFCKGEDEVTH